MIFYAYNDVDEEVEFDYKMDTDTKVGDIFLIAGDANTYEVISTTPVLKLKKLTRFISNSKGTEIVFNLTQFIKNFEYYMELVEKLKLYQEYIFEFKESILENCKYGLYEFLNVCKNIKVSAASELIDLTHLKPFYEILKRSKDYEMIKKPIPQFKKRKSPKKSSKKTPKKSSKKIPKKSSKKTPKKSSKKTPKKSSKKIPKKSSKKTPKKSSKKTKRSPSRLKTIKKSLKKLKRQ